MNYTQTSDTIKPIVNISATIEEINKHTEQVLKGENPYSKINAIIANSTSGRSFTNMALNANTEANLCSVKTK